MCACGESRYVGEAVEFDEVAAGGWGMLLQPSPTLLLLLLAAVSIES